MPRRPRRFLALALALFAPCAAWSAADAAWAALGDEDTAPAWRAAGSGRPDEAKALLSRLPATPHTRRLEGVLAEQASVPPPQVRFEAARVPVAFRAARNATPLVAALVNGVRIELGVDTGAGFSVLTRSAAAKVRAKPLEGITARVGDSLGKAVSAELFVVDLAIGGMEVRNLPVLVVDDARLEASFLGVTLFSFEGLIGWNALSASRLALDFEAKTLALGPPLAGCTSRDLFSLGFRPLV